MAGGRSPGLSRAKTLVIAALTAAAAFGLLLGYLAYTNDAFPAQERPFGDYAKVVSTVFNGTDYLFQVEWLSNSTIPLYAQLTSPTSDAANSPVCGLGLKSAHSGQTIEMPFAISTPSTSLKDVSLNIAVGRSPDSPQFTIVYYVSQASAQPGPIEPSDYACSQPRGQAI